MRLPTACPKPRTKAKPAPKYSSIVDRRSHAEKLAAAQKLRGTKPIRAKAKKRERNDPARIYGPETFVAFLHRQQCLGCGHAGRVEQAHRFTGGMGRKGSWRETVPLCGPRNIGGLYPIVRGCHRAYDGAKQSWSCAHNLPARAAWFWQQWLLHCGREGINPQTGGRA